MNAKNIMGAVLVALLAAALFVGAGAAADATDIGPVTTYTNLNGASFTVTSGTSTSDVKPFTPASGSPSVQTFIAADGTSVSTIVNGNVVYFAEDGDALNKKYSGNGITFTLVAPTASVAALNGVVNVIDSTVSQSVANNVLDFVYNFAGQTYKSSTSTSIDFVYIDEDGVKYTTKPTFTAGKWGVAAVLTGKGSLVTTTTPIYGQVYYFTVAKTEAAITAVADTVNVGENIVLKIQYPGQSVAVVIFDDDSVNYISGQAGVSAQKNDQAKGDYVEVTLGMDGTASVAFEADVKGKAKFSLAFLDANNNNAVTAAPGNPKVTVDIKKGEITAVADEDSYFTGNGIALSGTTTAGSDLFFYIEGQNYPLTQVNTVGGWNFGTAQNPDVVAAHAWFTSEGDLEVENGAWTAVLDPVEINKYTTKKLIAGTYTVIVSTYDYGKDGPKKDTDGDILTMKESIMDVVYGTAAVTLTQPFIENVKANAVAIQELDYEIT